MDTSEAIPGGAVVAPDLAELVTRRGPFVTVYLTTEPGVENAAQRSEQRWKTLRNSLVEAGAPEAMLGSIDPLVADAHQRGECLAAVASVEGLLHVEHGPTPPPADVGRFAPLPSLGQIVRWRQSTPPHVVVLADRLGADLVAVRHGEPDVTREAGGDESPITKVQPGGWSQLRYQQRAENTWQTNAKDVAEELVRLVRQVEARVVVVAGDVRAVQLLQDSLPEEVLGILRVVDGGRSADGSREEVESGVAAVLETARNEAGERLLEKFREELGQGDKAVEGIDATAKALSMGQVEALLVDESLDDGRTAWFGDDPIPVGLDPKTLEDTGTPSPQEGALVDVLIRAALGTSAGVRLVPSGMGPAEGVGALLRWSA